jgi:hypothetical protein
MKLTESYLRGIIKQVVQEAGYAPYPPPERYHSPETAHLGIGELAEQLGDAVEEENSARVLEVFEMILNSDTLTDEDLMKMAEATYFIITNDYTGSVQIRSDFVNSAPNMGRIQESRKRK